MRHQERRGFASMDEARRREIASAGGRASHERGVAHEFDSEEARLAGRKGGLASHERGSAHQFTSDEARRAGRKGGAVVSQDRAHMADIGQRGGARRTAATAHRARARG